MMKTSRKSANPFYALLVVAGIAFVVTATAFYVTTLRATAAGGAASAQHPLLLWMDQHGMTAMLAELVLLGVATLGAIATDDYWQRRNAGKHKAATVGRGPDAT